MMVACRCGWAFRFLRKGQQRQHQKMTRRAANDLV